MLMSFGSFKSAQGDIPQAGRHITVVPKTMPEHKPESDDDRLVLLTDLNAGALVIVSKITAESEAVRQLQAMGVCNGRKVQIIQAGDPMILRVLGTRLGVSARLAHTIWVHRLQCDCQETDKSSGAMP